MLIYHFKDDPLLHRIRGEHVRRLVYADDFVQTDILCVSTPSLKDTDTSMARSRFFPKNLATNAYCRTWGGNPLVSSLLVILLSPISLHPRSLYAVVFPVFASDNPYFHFSKTFGHADISEKRKQRDGLPLG